MPSRSAPSAVPEVPTRPVTASVATPPGLLVSRRVAEQDAAVLQEACRAAGVTADLIVQPPDGPLPPETVARITWALLTTDVIGTSSSTDEEPQLVAFLRSLQAAPALRWAQVCSAGMDRAAYGRLRDRGVRITSGAGTNAQSVAQSALAGLLHLGRDVPHWLALQRARHWAPRRGDAAPAAIEGTHAMIVGTGPIGTALARYLKALELTVTGVRRRAEPLPPFDRTVGLDGFDPLLPSVDWLILACPLTDATRGLVNAERLARLRPGAHLINVARGGVVDEPALIDALRDGRLAGAYLDVFAAEPLPTDSPLWDLPRVLISPHCAGSSGGFHPNVLALFRDNLARLVRGEALVNEWRPDARTGP